MNRYKINLAYTVSQDNENDELDDMNDSLHVIFGMRAEIDWRDEKEVWVTTMLDPIWIEGGTL